MKSKLSGLFKVGSAAVLGVWLVFQTATLLATEFQAKVGAQSGDLGRQVLAFLPNELWIHVGDSVTWAFPTAEPHTVTFLKPGQVRPFFDPGAARHPAPRATRVPHAWIPVLCRSSRAPRTPCRFQRRATSSSCACFTTT